MTTPDIHQAREWASRIKAEFVIATPFNEKTLAAAEVIQSLPDQWIDVEKVAELADDMSHWQLPDGPSDAETDYLHLVEIMDGFIGRIKDLVTPPLPTLEGLSDEERLKTKWGQADHATGRCVIVTPHVHTREGDGQSYDSATLMWPTGRIGTVPHGEVTPRPDLPPLKWPGSEPHISMEEMWVDDGSSPADAIQALADEFDEPEQEPLSDYRKIVRSEEDLQALPTRALIKELSSNTIMSKRSDGLWEFVGGWNPYPASEVVKKGPHEVIWEPEDKP